MSSHPPLRPLNPPMVPVVLAGLAAWAAAGLVVLIAGGPVQWQRICLIGFLIGLLGLPIMMVHDRRRARRRSAATSPHPGAPGSELQTDQAPG